VWGLTFSLLLGIIDHDQHTRTHGIVSTSNASDHTAACDDAAAAEVHPSQGGKKQRGHPERSVFLPL
jgi:hypothetical protein